jgi:hypothetical protein
VGGAIGRAIARREVRVTPLGAAVVVVDEETTRCWTCASSGVTGTTLPLGQRRSMLDRLSLEGDRVRLEAVLA